MLFVRLHSRKLVLVPDPESIDGAKGLPPVDQPARVKVVPAGRHVRDAPAQVGAIEQRRGKDHFEWTAFLFCGGRYGDGAGSVDHFVFDVVLLVVVDDDFALLTVLPKAKSQWETAAAQTKRYIIYF